MVGLDFSARQLDHARLLMAEAGVDFPLVEASAEAVPLPDASFDIVFCDHGAMTFADPYRTVPEAARLLRPGGLFAFNHHSPIEAIAWAPDEEHAGDRLVLDYFGMHRLEDEDTISFQLPYGEWIRLFRANGFTVEDLIEPRPGPDATSSYRDAEIDRLGAPLAVRMHLAPASLVTAARVEPRRLDLSDEAIARPVLDAPAGVVCGRGRAHRRRAHPDADRIARGAAGGRPRVAGCVRRGRTDRGRSRGRSSATRPSTSIGWSSHPGRSGEVSRAACSTRSTARIRVDACWCRRVARTSLRSASIGGGLQRWCASARSSPGCS